MESFKQVWNSQVKSAKGREINLNYLAKEITGVTRECLIYSGDCG